MFGFGTEQMREAGPDYHWFSLPGERASLGGMGSMMDADGTPAHWLVYLGVADTALAVAAAERAGGSVLAPTFDTPYGRMAGLADPAGAAFWVIQADGEGQPDREG
ncbi:hypothetical protein BH20ACT6_BH20ACT6_24760 [soil metagenome]